jgi:putative DNA primase/helicase
VITAATMRVPDSLVELDQWVLWRYEPRVDGGKPTKVPYQLNGRGASSTAPMTWCPWGEALKTYQEDPQSWSGIGFVFSASDPFVGIDLDQCIDDAGKLKPWAQPIMERFFDSYAEISPSGRGIKIWAKGSLPGSGTAFSVDDGRVEIYDRARFFTVTGNLWAGQMCDIEEHQTDLDWLLTLSPHGQKKVPFTVEGRIPKGRQHDTLVSLAGTMRARGCEYPEIEVALLEINRSRLEEPAPENNIKRIAESICRYTPSDKRGIAGVERKLRDGEHSSAINLTEEEIAECTGGAKPCESGFALTDPNGQELRSLPLTDSGNAERFERLYGGDFRYSAPERSWYAWTGKQWQADKTGRAMAKTKQVARALYREASDIEDKKARAEGAAWARRTEALERRRAIIVLAQSEGVIPITPDQWDAGPWLFNCASGTIDLRTGELRPHRREDLITRLAPVEYEPAARSELWDHFLRDSTGDDPEFINFLQRATGYSLTGDTREEVLFMPVGPGGTGKSTFFEAARCVMGDYARTADFETFTQKHGEGPRNDIAALAGKRMVISIEVEDGKRLAEGLVKSITGRDTISARFLYQEAFEFRPQFKLWLAANDAPSVRHEDDAIWRRILRLPFERVVPRERRDPTLKERLCFDPECQRAILAWAVAGALRWRDGGLAAPGRILRATEAYREEQNPLLDFLTDCCERSPGLTVQTSALRQAYEAWCARNGTQPISTQRFAAALRAEGFEQIRTESSRIWQGVGLKG